MPQPISEPIEKDFLMTLKRSGGSFSGLRRLNSSEMPPVMSTKASLMWPAWMAAYDPCNLSVNTQWITFRLGQPRLWLTMWYKIGDVYLPLAHIIIETATYLATRRSSKNSKSYDTFKVYNYISTDHTARTHFAYAFSNNDPQNSKGQDLFWPNRSLPSLLTGSRSSMRTSSQRPKRQNRKRKIPGGGVCYTLMDRANKLRARTTECKSEMTWIRHAGSVVEVLFTHRWAQWEATKKERYYWQSTC